MYLRGARACNWDFFIIPKFINWDRDSKMRVLVQTTTFWPLLSRANADYENE